MLCTVGYLIIFYRSQRNSLLLYLKIDYKRWIKYAEIGMPKTSHHTPTVVGYISVSQRESKFTVTATFLIQFRCYTFNYNSESVDNSTLIFLFIPVLSS